MSSMFDSLKGKAEELKDKAAGLVGEHSDTIHSGIDKTAQFADEKTGGKYADKIGTGATKAKETLEGLGGSKDDLGGEAPPPAAPPA